MNEEKKNTGFDLPEPIQKTEGRIQADCFKWFHNQFPNLRGLLYHVPNGGYRNKVEASNLKASGVVSGVPDLEFHFYRRTFFLECKTPTGRLSPDQVKIHSILNEHGFMTFVFRSLNEFQNIIWAIVEDKSSQFERAVTKKQFIYKNNVFMFLYEIPEGVVQNLSQLVETANLEKFKGCVFEFMNDGFDKKEGFEILFTPDFSGFYKKSITTDTNVIIDGYNSMEIPPKS